jgi:hypothetical protein
MACPFRFTSNPIAACTSAGTRHQGWQNGSVRSIGSTTTKGTDPTIFTGQPPTAPQLLFEVPGKTNIAGGHIAGPFVLPLAHLFLARRPFVGVGLVRDLLGVVRIVALLGDSPPLAFGP